MSFHVWPEYVIYDVSGYGYRVGEGDEEQITVYYFEDDPNQTGKEVFNCYNLPVTGMLIKQLKLAMSNRDDDGDFSEIDHCVEHEDGWGYNITNGDICEIIVRYYEDIDGQRKYKSMFSLYEGSGQHILAAIGRKLDEMNGNMVII